MRFVLTCAARAARGQTTTHNSMLVHVTRFVAVQELVADQIREELDAHARPLRYGDGDAPRQPDRRPARALGARLRADHARRFDDPRTRR